MAEWLSKVSILFCIIPTWTELTFISSEFLYLNLYMKMCTFSMYPMQIYYRMENIFANHISAKKLISKVFKRFIQLNSQKQITCLKSGQSF